MGFTNQERINQNSKVLAANVIDANEVGQWYESRFPFIIKLLDSDVALSTDFNQIPSAQLLANAQANALAFPTIIEDASVATSASTGVYNPGVEALRLTPIPSTNGSTYAAYSTYNNFLTARLTNWISPQKHPLGNGAPSNGYQVQLFEGDPFAGGTPVFPSDGQSGIGDLASVGWIFNYNLGMLYVSNDFRATLTDPYILAFRYIGQTLDQVVGNPATGKIITPVRLATTTFLADTPVYNNGALGVGATLTGTTAGLGLSIDGIAVAASDRLLINNQVNQFENGVYTVTDDGTGASPYVLTRATDADEPLELVSGLFVTSYDGTTNADVGWILATPDTAINIGVSNIQFAIMAGGSTTSIIDTDLDTFVDVENTPDDDTIRMSVGDNTGNFIGLTDVFTMNTSGVSILPPDSSVGGVAGGSVNIISGDGIGFGPVFGAGAVSIGVGSTTGSGALSNAPTLSLTGGDHGPTGTVTNAGAISLVGGTNTAAAAGAHNAGEIIISGGTGTVTSENIIGGNVTINSGDGFNGGAAGSLNLSSGDGGASGGVGGFIGIIAGSAIGGNDSGGSITMTSGGGVGTGSGGNFTMTSGAGTLSGSGGSFIMSGGSGDPGGNFSMSAGDAAAGSGSGGFEGYGGFLFINGGDGDGSGGGGNIQFTPGVRGNASAFTDGAVLMVPPLIQNGGGRSAELHFLESNTAGGFPLTAVGFRAPDTIAAASNVIWTLPDDDGTTGQVLTTDGSAALSWSTPSTGGLSVIGTRVAPIAVTAIGGVTGVVDQRTLYFVEGDGGAVIVTANPSINVGTIVGQELILMGRSDTNTLTFTNGNGIEINGSVTLGESDSISFIWDGTAWIETSRNI